MERAPTTAAALVTNWAILSFEIEKKVNEMSIRTQQRISCIITDNRMTCFGFYVTDVWLQPIKHPARTNQFHNQLHSSTTLFLLFIHFQIKTFNVLFLFFEMVDLSTTPINISHAYLVMTSELNAFTS